MFDIVSGDDGSGILFQNSYDDEILLEVLGGDTVELFLDGEVIFAEVISIDGRNITGVVSNVPFSSRECGLEEGDYISFALKHISRCMHE